MSDLLIAPKIQPFVVKECQNAQEAQDALNAHLPQDGWQLVTQVYQVIDNQTRYIYVFIKPDHAPQIGRAIAVPEHILKGRN